MYPLRRIFLSTKYLKNYIYTSSVKCKNSKNSDKDTPENSDSSSKDIKKSKTLRKKSRSEFLKLLNFTQEGKESSSSPDVSEKEEPVKSDEKPEKSKKRQKQSKEKKPGSGLENFFETASAEKAVNLAAESVAEQLGENKEEVKQDLMQYLQTLNVVKEKPQEYTYKIKPKIEYDTSLQSIFSNVKTLHIFDNLHAVPEESQLKLNIWDNLEHEELEYLSKVHPRNHFEELINWTKEGRMWNFPIDNEQGLDEEAKIPFTHHIFLEQYLEPWCPKKGPLRRFMDLVLTGLGKNPYLSVEEKKEHIYWFKDYFESKRKLLKEIGAMSSKEIEAPSSEEKS